MKVPINRDLITDQMNTLGLSERAILNLTGLPNASFRMARKEGLLEGSLSLRHVFALADALGVHVTDLLAQPETAPHTDRATTPVQRGTAADAATLIPLLVQIPKLVATDHLGRTLGWDRERLNAALDTIPTTLTGTGLRLHTHKGKAKIIAANPTDKRTQQALGRIQSTSRDLTTTEARALQTVIDGKNILDRKPSNPTRVAVGAIKNMGCIELDDNGIFTTTAALRLALPDL